MQSKKEYSLFFIFGTILFAGIVLTQGNKPDLDQQSLFDQLQKESITELILKTNLEQIIANANDVDYGDGKLTFVNGDTSNVVYDIKVKPRGVTRKQICDFPPLKIKFSKTDLEANGMDGYKTLKLVTHCKEGEDFEQVLLKEYTAYKMYNVLTEKSFRVQLVKITYEDANQEIEPSTHYGFLIENKQELADRIGAELKEKDNSILTQIDANQYRLFTLFQYMIGNTDWNLSKQHNVKLLIENEKISPLPVPYDFDFAGLVNAPYATPYSTLPIENVKQRFFQFKGNRNTDFRSTYDLFNAKKAEIMCLHTDFNLLDEPVKIEMTNYLKAFFDLINEHQVADEKLSLNGAYL